MSTLNATNLKHASSGTNNIVLDSSARTLMGGVTANANGGVLQLSSGITFPATQVSASDANTLDDYEEGTWTPVVFGTATAGSSTTAVSSAIYTKIGAMVSIQFYYYWTSGTGSGDLRISGLPFTNGATNTALIFSHVESLTMPAGSSPGAYISASEASIRIMSNTVTAGVLSSAAVAYDASAGIMIAGTYGV